MLAEHQLLIVVERDQFVELMELWKAGGALEMEVLQQSDTRFDFNFNRCRYAEMYREMGLQEISHLLSCNRDGSFFARALTRS